MSAAVPDDLPHSFRISMRSRAARSGCYGPRAGSRTFYTRRNRKFKAWLTSKGIPFTSVEIEGVHTWPGWRRNLVDLLPALFR
jgi:S-formylglutathione hydrolase FrmB